MKNKIAVIALLMVSVTIGTLFPKIVLTYQDKNLQNKTERNTGECFQTALYITC